ncbi:hypothetical protein [Alysiella filiformis]|nr:hypothetical protein [Alysiella filiformis]UBQ57002.1 hypothetical protein JF568_04415 [Alysiella filiformis DSM 16848]
MPCHSMLLDDKNPPFCLHNFAMQCVMCQAPKSVGVAAQRHVHTKMPHNHFQAAKTQKTVPKHLF